MGCSYRSYYCTLQNEKQEFFLLDDNQWRECNPVNPLKEYQTYIENNVGLVQQIVKTISKIIEYD